MTAARITPFAGIAPKVAPELLPDNGAQVAVNCRVNTGDLSPLRGSTAAGSTTKAGTPKSIFRIDETAGAAWLAWVNDVDCVRGPITGLGRYYYSGDGVPKATTLADATNGGALDYPKLFRAIGVPKPITKPTVTPSGGALADISRYYMYSFYDDWNQESAFSPISDLTTGKPDGTWAIAAMDAAPPNTGAISAITYVGTTVMITGAVTHFNRVGDEVTIAGVTTVTNINGTWTLTAADSTAKTMSFVVTTAPTGTYNNATDTTDTWTRTAPWGTCTKRLYRTSGTLAQFQLVAEGITATTYSDTILDSDPLFPGDEAISATWDPPPVGLKGIASHPSGALVGFDGNELCFSEPYQPHAWPPEYRLRTSYPIVAIAVFGSTVVVATDALPYVAQGYEPGQIALDDLKEPAPCMAKRSMAGVPDGALFAGSDGLMKIGAAGVENLTIQTAFTKEQWRAMNPATMQLAYAGGVVYLTYTRTGEAQRLLILSDALTEAEIDADGIYTNPFDGDLHYIKNGAILSFDSDDSRLLMQDWKSKEIVLRSAETWTAARVRFESEIDQAILDALQAEYDAIVVANAAIVAGVVAGTRTSGGALNGMSLNARPVNASALAVATDPGNTVAEVTFSLYADGALKYARVVSDENIFRLPGGYMTRRYAVRVGSSTRIKSIEIGPNPQSLAQV